VNKPSRGEIAVVIPCYCCADTIERAVQSVRNQTLLPKQIIMIDDGSSDHGATRQAMLRVQEKLTHIIDIELILFEKNRGVASARNAGWDNANYDFIAFLDADDTWHPEKLKIQYNWMLKNPEIAICGHFCDWYGNQGGCINTDVERIESTLITKNSMLMKNPFSTPTVMLRRSCSLRFENGKQYAEDYFLWLCAIYSDFKVARLNMKLASLYKPPYGSAGLSADLSKMEQGVLECFEKLYQLNKISYPTYIAVVSFSKLKYLKRVITVFARGLFCSRARV